MKANILFVDDDPDILIGYRRSLKKDFLIDTAIGAEEAIPLIQSQGPYAVVVSDMRMPRVNGIELLGQIEKLSPDTVRIMLTGNADQKTAKDAVNEGHIFRFLTKPCPPEEMTPALNAALAQYRLITAERELLEKTLNGSARVLTEILATHDPISFGRAQRAREAVTSVAKQLQLAQTWDLELAAALSRIGCVTIPQDVLKKGHDERLLTASEKDMIARIPQLGYNLLSNIPRLESVASIVLYQNKNFDGTGFPCDAVSGEQIPMGARILRVLSDLLVDPPDAQAQSKALARMMKAAGRYDTKVLGAAAVVFDVCLTDAPSSDLTVRAIRIGELRVGHVVQQDVRTKDGSLIAPAATRISPLLIQRLRNFADLGQLVEPLLISDSAAAH